MDSSQKNFERINSMMKEKGVLTDKGTGLQYYTGYSYATLYDWDQYFEAIIQSYMGWDMVYAKNAVNIFLRSQRADGFIGRSVPPGGEFEAGEMVKPFLAQTAYFICKKEKNFDWLTEKNYGGLKKAVAYWTDGPGKSENGLSVWRSGPHTGMDNQHERAGKWEADYCEGADLNCYLIRECRAMAKLAEMTDRADDVSFFDSAADKLKLAVQSLWHEGDGIFYDRDRRTGELIKVKYAGAFAALWAKAATPEQAERMVTGYITNPNEFWRAFPLSVYAASEPGYREHREDGDLGCNWRANTWIPVNYYVFQGLRSYGYNEAAKLLAYMTYEAVAEIGDREYYNSDSRTGCGLDPFWGWSLLAYFMPDEFENGCDPTSLG